MRPPIFDNAKLIGIVGVGLGADPFAPVLNDHHDLLDQATDDLLVDGLVEGQPLIRVAIFDGERQHRNLSV
jgi:hypothetical protein